MEAQHRFAKQIVMQRNALWFTEIPPWKADCLVNLVANANHRNANNSSGLCVKAPIIRSRNAAMRLGMGMGMVGALLVTTHCATELELQINTF